MLFTVKYWNDQNEKILTLSTLVDSCNAEINWLYGTEHKCLVQTIHILSMRALK